MLMLNWGGVNIKKIHKNKCTSLHGPSVLLINVLVHTTGILKRSSEDKNKFHFI